jgi:hypothetical protein
VYTRSFLPALKKTLNIIEARAYSNYIYIRGRLLTHAGKARIRFAAFYG